MNQELDPHLSVPSSKKFLGTKILNLAFHIILKFCMSRWEDGTHFTVCWLDLLLRMSHHIGLWQVGLHMCSCSELGKRQGPAWWEFQETPCLGEQQLNILFYLNPLLFTLQSSIASGFLQGQGRWDFAFYAHFFPTPTNFCPSTLGCPKPVWLNSQVNMWGAHQFSTTL